ncbi:Inositol hexakisphosphate and diphosphoinositol-pentakisphosphate kinase [Balamuthia mandrillaris]
MVARFPYLHPAVLMFPKHNKTGQVIEDHYGGIAFLSVHELGHCVCCKGSKLPGQYLDCDDGIPTEILDVRQWDWHRETVLDKQTGKLHKVVYSSEDEARQGASLRVVWEAIRDNEHRPVSNGQAERVLALTRNNLKFTVELDNYTSVIHGDDAPNQLWALAVRLVIFMSREPLYTPNFLGTFNIAVDQPSEWQWHVYLRSKEPPYFRYDLTQSMFSIADPPSVSRVIEPNTTLHGFEPIDSRKLGVYTEANGTIVKGEFLEITLPAGSNHIFYDPELSVLLETSGEEDGEGDGEQDGEDGVVEEDGDGEGDADGDGKETGRKEGGEDDEDEWIPIVGGVLGGILLVGAVAAFAAFMAVRWWVAHKRRQQVAAVNF